MLSGYAIKLVIFIHIYAKYENITQKQSDDLNGKIYAKVIAIKQLMFNLIFKFKIVYYI